MNRRIKQPDLNVVGLDSRPKQRYFAGRTRRFAEVFDPDSVISRLKEIRSRSLADMDSLIQRFSAQTSNKENTSLFFAKEASDAAGYISRTTGSQKRIAVNRGCCGMGGTWALKSKKQSDLSGKIGGPVFEKIKELKPQLLSADCAGCQIQIARHTGLSEKELAHPVQIIAEAYRNYIKPHLPKTGFIRS